MSMNYLENYLGSIEKLPYDLQRKFNLIQELDTQVRKMMETIDDSAKAFYSEGNDLTKEERNQFHDDVSNTFKKCSEFTLDKVQVAIQAYDMVDKHIRRLDSDMSRFDYEEDVEPTCKVVRKALAPKRRKSSTTGARKIRKSSATGSRRGSVTPLPAPGNFGIDIDMPVDPNEPTYCICNQVSFGEMIACDNSDCPTEWFHFQCVGLTARPKGKWFCPRCREAPKNEPGS